MTRSLATLAILASLTAACNDDVADEAGSGTAQFTVYGEDFIEEGIPAEEVEDGWAITFDRFLIVLGPITVADSTAGEGAVLASRILFDMTAPGPHDVGTTGALEARAWDEVGFDIAPFGDDTEVDASASDEDAEWMEENGYAVYVEGSATREDVTKTFHWGFTGATEYRECVEVDEAGEDVRPGILVTNGGVTDVQITIHGDHFFYDDLTAANAVLRFDALALADDLGDADQEITREELDAVQLVDVDTGTYGTGSASDVNTLGDFVTALTTTLGHYQGEGHCHSHGE